MAKRDLKLNSLDRYSKSSPRLVLEEHGHCEVPAGCGGVVLRWRNLDSGLIFTLQAFFTGKGRMLIDGIPPESGRPIISYGAHVIAMETSELIPGKAATCFAAIHDESKFGFPRVSQPSGRKIEILSAAGATWKYTTVKPPDNTWMQSGFDDSSWHAMSERRAPSLNTKEMPHHRLQSVLRTGAVCLGIDGDSPQAWIRKSFRVDPMDSQKNEGGQDASAD